jgi:hypothetical protein
VNRLDEERTKRLIELFQEIKNFNDLDQVLLVGLKTLVSNYTSELLKGKAVSINQLDSIWQGLNEVDIHYTNILLLIDNLYREVETLYDSE